MRSTSRCWLPIPGKIRLVYRHLPLTSIHPDAFSAAEAAMCAGEQNVYWQYHEKLFSSETLGNSDLRPICAGPEPEYGRRLRPALTSINIRMPSRRIATLPSDLGIRSTPTFFINGLAIVGAQPLDVFKQVIDKELAGEIPE